MSSCKETLKHLFHSIYQIKIMASFGTMHLLVQRHSVEMKKFGRVTIRDCVDICVYIFMRILKVSSTTHGNDWHERLW